MKILSVVAVSALVLTGCQTANAGDNWAGPVIGGVAGGIIGNQVGKGSGKTVATAAGAVIGVLVGQELSRPHETVIVSDPGHHHHPRYYRRSYDECAGYRTHYEYQACQRGIAEREHQARVEAEKRAYSCARYGRCY